MTDTKSKLNLTFEAQLIRIFTGDETFKPLAPGLPDANCLRRYFLCMLLASIPCVIAAVAYISAQILANIAACFFCAVATEMLFAKIRKKPVGAGAPAFAILLALIVPADIPIWMICAGTVFGVVVGKEIFGGTGHYLFNPILVAAGFIYFSYPHFQTHSSFANCFGILKSNQTDFAICTGLTAIGFAGSIVARKNSFWIFAGALSGIFIAAFSLLPGVLGEVNLISAKYNSQVSQLVFANGLIFITCFLATDPATVPATNIGRISYGFFIGTCAILLANFSKHTQFAAISAVLLGNMLTPLFDSMLCKFSISEKLKMKDGKIYPVIFITILSLLCAGVITLASQKWESKISANEKIQRNTAIVTSLGLVDDAKKKPSPDAVKKIFASNITSQVKNGLEIFTAKNESGKLIGQAVCFEVKGFKGPIRGVIAFNSDRTKLLGLRIYKQSETPAYGGRIASKKIGWYKKFANKAVLRNGKPGRFIKTKRRTGSGYIDALSSPTCNGTMTALDRALTKITERYLQATAKQSALVNAGGTKKNAQTSGLNYAKEIKDWSRPTKPYAGKRPKNSLKQRGREYTIANIKSIPAPAGVKNISRGKSVTSNTAKDVDKYFGADDASKVFVELTDGKLACPDDESGLTVLDWDFLEEKTHPFFQVDLGERFDIYAIGIWHFYYRARWYKDVVILASDDPKFEKNVSVLWSNDDDNTLGFGKGAAPYFPTAWYGHVLDVMKIRRAQIKSKNGVLSIKGKPASAPKQAKLTARYIRVYTGKSFNGFEPSLVEIAAWGKPAKSETVTKSQKNTPAKSTKVPLELAIPKLLPNPTPKPVTWKHLAKKPVGPDRILLPAGCKNLALNKPVTSSTPEDELVMGELNFVTDGNKVGDEDSVVILDVESQWVQIDLGKPAKIYAIACWHYHQQKRVYKGVVIQLADDEKFTKNVRTIFNNDIENLNKLGKGKDLRYWDTIYGKVIPVRGLVARYVRLYSAGNSSDDDNHYVEVEVYGKTIGK